MLLPCCGSVLRCLRTGRVLAALGQLVSELHAYLKMRLRLYPQADSVVNTPATTRDKTNEPRVSLVNAINP